MGLPSSRPCKECVKRRRKWLTSNTCSETLSPDKVRFFAGWIMKGSHARYTAILTLALLPVLPVFAQHAGQGSDYPNHIYNTAPAVASKGTVLVLTVNDD